GPRHRRRREPRRRCAVHGHRHPEPDRAGGNLSSPGGPARPLHHEGLDRVPGPRVDPAHPGGSRDQGARCRRPVDCDIGGDRRDGCARSYGARRPFDQRLRLAARGCHAHGRRGAARSQRARCARAHPYREDARRGERTSLRHSRRHQGARRARSRAQARARPRGGVRGGHSVEHHQPGADRDPAAHRQASGVSNRTDSSRSTVKTARGATRAVSGATTRSVRFDTLYDTSTEGLTNARTKIVGNRTGFFADVLIVAVRATTGIRGLVSRWWARASAVVTPLGWSLALLVPLAFVFGYLYSWLELVAVAWAVLVLVIVAAAYLFGRGTFLVHLGIPHNRVVVGESAIGIVTASNPSRRRRPGVKVEVPVG